MSNNIEWKCKGLFKADANKCYDEITSLGDETSAQTIVDYAEDPNTELHKCFTWDDTKAANKWRKQEARLIVGNLVVRYTDSKNETQPLRVFVRTETGRNFTSVKLLHRDNDKYAEMLRQAKAELAAFKRKYHQVRELDTILELIDW